ncbi:MAG: transposase [Magnetococcales bacterium]|nr:transposase [Magnetococcales bacterium]
MTQGSVCLDEKVSGQCAKILTVAPALWTFARILGVEPTNNAAERAVRHGVLWRKGCFGTDSEAGSRFAERIMTVAATCRQQKRNVLEFLMQAIHADLRGQAAPSLLPR